MIHPSIIFRRYRKKPGKKAISIVSLGVTFACLLLIIAHAKFELSYDRFHKNHERIVRLTIEPKEGLPDARIFGTKTRELPASIPEISEVTLISPLRQGIATVNNQSFKLEKAFYVDSSFFKIFDFQIKKGSKVDPLTNLNSIIVSEAFAWKHFGSENIIGESVKISSRDMAKEGIYTISGIMYNTPANSHFKTDVLVLRPKDIEFFFYTYLLLQNREDIKIVPDKLVELYKSKGNDTTQLPVYNLQCITDIHLHSNKAREIERNGSYQSLVLLISTVILILIIALINLLNSSRMLFLSNRDYYFLKRIHGASIGILVVEELIQGLITSVLIIILGLLCVHYGGGIFSIPVFTILSVWELVGVSIIFLIILLMTNILPILRYFLGNFFSTDRNSNFIQYRFGKSKTMHGFIVVQIAISVFVIALSIGFARQMDYVMGKQLGGKTEGIIVIPEQPQGVIKNFDRFKEELLNSPHILAVTASMEPPAGAIKDRTQIEFEGETHENPIDILCVDADFFSFFDLSLLAGEMFPRYPYSYEWEGATINTTMLMKYGIKPPADFKLPDEYSDYFIVNRMALAELGISSAEDALGKRIRLKSHPVLDIIPGGRITGVVDDFKYTSMYEKERALIILQRKLFTDDLLIRYEAKSEGEAIGTIRDAWQKVNPDFPLSYESIQETYKKVYYNEFNSRRVLSSFSLLSLLISSLGLAVLMAFLISQRIKEIGIRKVNGAGTWDILIMLNRMILLWVLAAFVIATPLSYLIIDRWLHHFAYQTSLSWWIFIDAGAIALLIALVTVSWQSWLAARMNPIEAIRYE